MKVLVVGGGGREHALTWKISQSPLLEKVYCAPGNAGIAQVAECLDIKDTDVEGLVEATQNLAIDLVVVGPEAPLVLGLADKLRALDIPVFGPSKKASQLEGSKGFMKDLLAKYNIPTAAYGRFTDFEEAKEFINRHGAPIVIKTDGLAAGKGVIICENVSQAVSVAQDMLSGDAFGAAGKEIIIEEFMEGEEISYFALCDGETVLPLSSAQDHKRIGEGDTGPNTGGMGAYSPAHLMTPQLEREIYEKILTPTLEGMKAEGCAFTGVLFAGVMLVQGQPKVLEFNIRFGDPECQALMARLHSDLLPILDAAAKGQLKQIKDSVSWKPQHSLCVVMAANGYPGSYPKNTLIKDLGGAVNEDEVILFHAGTGHDKTGDLVSTGGRVLGVTGLGDTLQSARDHAYARAEKIQWDAGYYRKDIGWRAIK